MQKFVVVKLPRSPLVLVNALGQVSLVSAEEARRAGGGCGSGEDRSGLETAVGRGRTGRAIDACARDTSVNREAMNLESLAAESEHHVPSSVSGRR